MNKDQKKGSGRSTSKQPLIKCGIREAIAREVEKAGYKGNVVLKGYELIVTEGQDSTKRELNRILLGDEDTDDCFSLELRDSTLRLEVPLHIVGDRQIFTNQHMRGHEKEAGTFGNTSLPQLILDSVRQVGEHKSGNALDLCGGFELVELSNCTLRNVELDLRYEYNGFRAQDLIIFKCRLDTFDAWARESEEMVIDSGRIAERLRWSGGQIGRLTWFTEPFVVCGYKTGYENDVLGPPPRVTGYISVANPHWLRFFQALCPGIPIRYSGPITSL